MPYWESSETFFGGTFPRKVVDQGLKKHKIVKKTRFLWFFWIVLTLDRGAFWKGAAIFSEKNPIFPRKAVQNEVFQYPPFCHFLGVFLKTGYTFILKKTAFFTVFLRFFTVFYPLFSIQNAKKAVFWAFFEIMANLKTRVLPFKTGTYSNLLENHQKTRKIDKK